MARDAESAREKSLSRRARGTSPSVDLAAYAGRYLDPLYGEAEVRQQGDKLVIQYGRRSGELEHWEYDTFRFDWQTRWRGGGSISFEIGSGGRVVGARLNGMALWRQRSEQR